MRSILLVLLLAACAQTPAPTPAPANSELAQRIRADNEQLARELRADGIVAAAIGESANLGGGLIVRPLEVIEDSRCPQNATCIWAGRLRLRADVSGQTRELILGEVQQTPHGALTLEVASPGSWSEWPSPRPAYRFGFRRS